MEKITYGAPRYMDWVAQIRAGAATVRVHFTGGALTVYGVTPAEYSTSDPFVQKVIEQSQYFKEGRIVKLRSTPVADPRGSYRPKKRAGKAAEATAEQGSKGEESPATEQAVDAAAGKTDTGESVHQPNRKGDEDTQALKEIEVNCLPDAQDYLQQNYGIASYKVRSKVSAQKAAMEHGVQFVGPGFDTSEEGIGSDPTP